MSQALAAAFVESMAGFNRVNQLLQFDDKRFSNRAQRLPEAPRRKWSMTDAGFLADFPKLAGEIGHGEEAVFG